MALDLNKPAIAQSSLALAFASIRENFAYFAVNATATSVTSATLDVAFTIQTTATTTKAELYISSGSGVTSARNSYIRFEASETTPQEWRAGMQGTKNFTIKDQTSGRVPITIDQAAGLVTIAHGILGTGRSAAGWMLELANANEAAVRVAATTTIDAAYLHLNAGNGTTSSRNAYLALTANETTGQDWRAGMFGTKDFVIRDVTGARTPITIAQSDGRVTFSGAAYSPNAFVVQTPTNNGSMTVLSEGAGTSASVDLVAGNNTTSNRIVYLRCRTAETVPQAWIAGMNASKDFVIRDDTSARIPVTIAQTTGAVTLAHGLVMSGVGPAGHLIEATRASGQCEINIKTLTTIDTARLGISVGNGTTSSRNAYVYYQSVETATATWFAGLVGSKNWVVNDSQNGRTPISVAESNGLVTFANGTSDTLAQTCSVGANIASAATIAPTAPVTHVTGTTTISTITPPATFSVAGKGGEIVLIPDGLWSTNTAGNIAFASTAVVGRALILFYDNATLKWYPSY